MAKYHINSRGEPGRCRAQKNCPFGGEAHHYPTSEAAQQAYELSMASGAISSVKKVTARDKRLEADAVEWVDNLAETQALEDIMTTVAGDDFGHLSQEDGEKMREYALDYTEKLLEESEGPSTLNELSSSEKIEFGIPLTERELQKEFAKSRAIMQEINQQKVALWRRGFDSSLYGGFKFDDIYFDEVTLRSSYEQNWRNRTPPANDGEEKKLQEHIEDYVANRRKSFEAAQRTDVAKSNEENVPIRLIPTGSTVKILDRKSWKGKSYSTWTARKVGKPVDNGANSDGLHDVVGKYHDGVQWAFVDGNALFNTADVDNGKKLDNRWAHENARAAQLADHRRAFDRGHRLTSI